MSAVLGSASVERRRSASTVRARTSAAAKRATKITHPPSLAPSASALPDQVEDKVAALSPAAGLFLCVCIICAASV